MNKGRSFQKKDFNISARAHFLLENAASSLGDVNGRKYATFDGIFVWETDCILRMLPEKKGNFMRARRYDWQVAISGTEQGLKFRSEAEKLTIYLSEVQYSQRDFGNFRMDDRQHCNFG